MTVPIPITSLFPCQFRHPSIRDIQGFKEIVKIFCVRKLKYQFLKGLGIFQSILNCLINTFYPKETF